MSDPDDGDQACSSSDRRHEDEQLLAALRATAFGGKKYDEFLFHIIRYGTGVLWKMIRTGAIWNELEKIDRPRARPDDWCPRDKEQLVNDSVNDGYLDFFRKVLFVGGWDSSRASLNTLYVRYCLSRFADHYQTWYRSSLTRNYWEVSQRDPEYPGSPHAPSAERAALAKQEVAELGPEQFAHGAGYSHKEIGDMLDISDRAVEGRLYRARSRDADDDERRA
jgi:DNA-directed RNA polymerase specialized sigma24 family protein